jgi:hypothetical protein
LFEYPHWIGNGYCSDEVNNEGCSYDAGDCCGPNANTDWCTECICYADPDCAAPLELIANGFCNDEANIAGCGFDGGDCCRACINAEFCIECLCYNDTGQSLTKALILPSINSKYIKISLWDLSE